MKMETFTDHTTTYKTDDNDDNICQLIQTCV